VTTRPRSPRSAPAADHRPAVAAPPDGPGREVALVDPDAEADGDEPPAEPELLVGPDGASEVALPAAVELLAAAVVVVFGSEGSVVGGVGSDVVGNGSDVVGNGSDVVGSVVVGGSMAIAVGAATSASTPSQRSRIIRTTSRTDDRMRGVGDGRSRRTAGRLFDSGKSPFPAIRL
jgi:hypothetical protein